jgi:hypothetical protein
MDPLAEKYPSISPYAYCLGNPLKYIDPTGAATVPVYNIYGTLVGTTDDGLQGDPFIMDAKNFVQGMSKEEAKKYDLGEEGLDSEEARAKYKESRESLSSRPDYDGFVTISEGIAWAKAHPNALQNPTPENSLYINTALLDFGNLSVDGEMKLNLGKPVARNLFNNENMKASVTNPRLRATVYALGVFNVVLHDPSMRTVSVYNDEATDYNWNRGGGFARDTAIRLERLRAGLDDTHGFKVYYYGIGHLNN